MFTRYGVANNQWMTHVESSLDKYMEEQRDRHMGVDFYLTYTRIN